MKTPILKYPGAKWRIACWIIERIPPHEGYVEPYFGSGAVFFNKPKSRVETINDVDGSVVRFFKVCREQPEALAYALSLTPWSREEYERSELYHDGDIDAVEEARQFAVRSYMAFGSCMSTKTGWRHTTGIKKDGGPDNPKLWGRLPQLVHEVASRLQDAQIENRPALDVIKSRDGEAVLIYADPPYVMDTRTAHRDQYRYEMTDTDHEALLQTLRKHKGMVLLSGYDCELYNDYLCGWDKKTVNTRAERGATRTECLWINPAAIQASGQMQIEMCPRGGTRR